MACPLQSALESVTPLETLYLGAWIPQPLVAGGDSTLLVASSSLSGPELRKKPTTANSDILISAAVDSACMGHLTCHRSALVNIRPCKDKFVAADGAVAPATCIGDMPVAVRDSDGTARLWLVRNVRCVPAFHYTLLSVTQLWEEQRIDSAFGNTRSLLFEVSGKRDPVRIPFSADLRLPSVSLVSMAGNHRTASRQLAPTSAGAPPLTAAPASIVFSSKALGWHRVGTTAHIARLPAAQAAEVLHRRSHLGIDKLRATAHTTADAPKNLASASASARASSCPSCAASHIQRTPHSSTLDAPAPEPGTLHIDLKELVLSIGSYRWALFATDEYSRYVFVEFIRHKSEADAAVKRIIAAFNATVYSPIDEAGRALPRPRVRHVHSDREGKLMSHHFRDFCTEASVYHTTSPGHDHDLNPISERIIGVISQAATAIRDMSDAPIRLWPWLIAYAVEWHNSTVTAVGSSSADGNISPHQRFTLRPPKIMDLAAFGCRAVVLKAPKDMSKTTLSTPGWTGSFLGRSRYTKGGYDVLVGQRVVTSSSVMVDEEWFDWAPPAKRHQPLTAASHTVAAPQRLPLHPSLPPAGVIASAPSTAESTAQRFLNLFSGPYARTDGLAPILRALGWAEVDQIDNDGEKGGGWGHDLLNDSVFSSLLAHAAAGRWDAIMIAFPCSTASVSRFFDAAVDGGDRGPPVVRDHDRPDGLPEDEIDPKHVRELRLSNLLLQRTVQLALAARNSPARTIIVWENPADRSDESSTAYASELSRHGSIFATTAFKRLAEACGMFHCTFAYCRLDAPYQKYTSLYYTPELASVLDELNSPDYQCNHPRGSHSQRVGGRDADGTFGSSKRAAAYPSKLIAIIARAFTFGRTGLERVPVGPAPPLGPRADSWPAPPSSGGSPPSSGGSSLPASDAGGVPPPASPVSPARVGGGVPTSSAAPRASPIAFPPLDAASPSPGSPGSPASPLHATVRSAVPPTPLPPRELRNSGAAKAGSSSSLAPPAASSRRAGSRASASLRLPPVAEVDETPEGPTSLPGYSPGGTSTAGYDDFLAESASVMEAAVSEVLLRAASDMSGKDNDAGLDLVPVTPWSALAASRMPRRTRSRRLANGGHAVPLFVALPEGSKVTPETIASLHAALRADSPGAPSTHREAVNAGEIWIGAEGTELKNHKRNQSWTTISRNEVPHGRRIHKLIWVYKLKRDGTAKARLCVQGNTLQSGIDYDQTFSAALRYSSARALFAYAARKGCRVRSVDLVAAYLQGRFLDGEVVYCHLPQGYPEHDRDGQPRIARIEKPIYGIQQAGRRLQRMLFAWLVEQGFAALDDSDPCVFTRAFPDGEILTIGVYVDNLQIVHSVTIDADGRGPEGCAYNSLMDALVKDWDVVDEGPMEDLLGIEVDYLNDGAIKLHQTTYVRKMVERFLPNGPLAGTQRNSLPYSSDFLKHVADALSGDPCTDPSLIKSMQERIGCLMYAATSTRCDIAFAVQYLCRCLQRPTAELIRETDHIFSYLARNPSIGLTYSKECCGLDGFADASWETAQSTSGWVIQWQSAALSWGSRKQKSIALSTCEAEIIALSEAAKDVVYLRKLVNGLGEPESGPSPLRTDSQSARDVSYNPEHHDKMKHVQRRHFFVRDMVESFEIEVPFVRTADNIADFFTKPMKSSTQFNAFRKHIMNES